MDVVPVQAFLDGYPLAIREVTEVLRDVVRQAAPQAVERVRPGWRLIGYDLPVRRHGVYFAYVAPEHEHVHLGFEVGVFMDDPGGLLEGAHLGLRKVRFVTFRPGEVVPRSSLVELTREAARVAAMARPERLARLLDRDDRPADPGDGQGTKSGRPGPDSGR